MPGTLADYNLAGIAEGGKIVWWGGDCSVRIPHGKSTEKALCQSELGKSPVQLLPFTKRMVSCEFLKVEK